MTLDHWKTREPIAVLSSGEKDIWRLTLSHSHGPRSVVITDSGTVVLLDEWVRIKSAHAVTVIPPTGKGVQDWSFDEVRTILDVPSKTLTQSAKIGMWMFGTPTVKGSVVSIPAGGKTLTIDTKAMKLNHL